MGGKDRRTLAFIKSYPRPYQIFEKITKADPWPYKDNREFYVKRDRALVAITYLLAARISEVLRLKKNQISHDKNMLIVKEIKLSKSTHKDKRRRVQFRQEAFLTLTGSRAPLTNLILAYLELIYYDDDLLFPFSTVRAWQIITHLTGEPPHYLRAYGENFLYDMWKQDLLAVADYIKVDPATLQQYIRRSYIKYKPV